MPEQKNEKAKAPADRTRNGKPAFKQDEKHRHDKPISLSDARKKRKDVAEQLRIQSDRLARVQKAVEQGVRTSKEYFERFPGIGVITDPEGIVTDANKKATEAFQTAKQALSGKSLSDFVLEEDRSIFQLHLQRCRKRNQREHFQMRLKTPDGNHLEVDTLIAPFGVEEHQVQKIFWAIRIL